MRTYLGSGLIFGFLGFVLSFVGTLFLTIIDDSTQWFFGVEMDAYSTIDLVVWVHYSAIWTPIDSDFVDLAGSSGRILTETPPDMPVILFYLVPIVSLVVLAYANASANSGNIESRRDAMIAGQTIVVGFAITSTAVAILYETQIETFQTVTVGIDVPTAALMSVLYGIVVGGLGGVLWWENRDFD